MKTAWRNVAMNRQGRIEERLGQAFKLAYFIHGNKETAIRIAINAALKLDAASAAQDKRRYYKAATRNKVSYNIDHLLQRLVYIESEPYELARETTVDRGGLDDRTLLIHFIKHLVKITCRRTSFYVNLGMSRVLHYYSTRETMEVYNTIVQDPSRVKEDSYYRSRKSVLVKELLERFDGRISLRNGQRNEVGFETQPITSHHRDLVEACLTRFTPWGTSCVVPDNYSPTDQELPSLAFRGSEPDEEYFTEVSRMHAILHPDCYKNIIDGLRGIKMRDYIFEDPDLTLQIPRFNLSCDEDTWNNHHDDRLNPNDLTEHELAAIQSELAEEDARRKAWGKGLLRISVDGDNRALLDPGQGSTATIHVNPGEEMVEIHGISDDRETLLGVQLLTYLGDHDSPFPTQFAFKLANTSEINFGFRPGDGFNNASGLLNLDVTCQKQPALSPGNFSAFLGQKFRALMDNQIQNNDHLGRPGFRPAYLLYVLLVIGVLTTSYLGVMLWKANNRLDQLVQYQQPASLAPIMLTQDHVRSSGMTQIVRLPADESPILLMLKLEQGSYKSYEAVIQDVDKRSDVVKQKINADTTIGDDKWIVLLLPSSKLPAGDYQIKLSAITEQGGNEVIGNYPLSVRNR